MANDDLYAILGVDSDADEKTIRKKYRELAMKWHPDKNQDQLEEAQKVFQQINQAYSVLSDPDRRRKYDVSCHSDPSYRARWAATRRVGSAPTYEALYDQIYGRNGAWRSSTERTDSDVPAASADSSVPRGEGNSWTESSEGFSRGKSPDLDLHIDVHCTLEEMFDCAVKFLKASRQMEDGQYDTKSVKVTLTPGVSDRTIIPLQKQGNRETGRPPGDLILTICQVPHDRFIRVGDDLIEEISITLANALSCDFEIDSMGIDGEHVSYLCDEVIQNGSTIRMAGRGMHHPDGTRGDHIFRFNVLIPLLNAEQRRQIIEILAE
jgi:DnaJ-class molecular chaperone